VHRRLELREAVIRLADRRAVRILQRLERLLAREELPAPRVYTTPPSRGSVVWEVMAMRSARSAK
jgi:hypothetical protein